MAKVKVFLKEGQTSRSQGQNFFLQWKCLVTRDVHILYESPTSSGEETMAKVKVF